ncbi:MAG: DUF362 domain-containing protein [Candidatus Omnitrophica bacterium]|nr:DUF362 domain-containing protein [Candidatus Omnitrophota bacterium]
MKHEVAVIDHMDAGEGIRGALNALGDISGLFRHRHVAIKPNETWAAEDDKTACTQAESLREVIRYIKAFSPAEITVTGGSGAGETDHIFSVLGLDEVIREEKVGFVDHNRPSFREVPLRHGPQKSVIVNEKILRYETLVSLAQLKVHDLADVTLTLKNIAMSYPAAGYYGYPRKKRKHDHLFFDDIHSFIPAMCEIFPVDVGIITGYPAMTEKGPIGGHTFNAGITIASTDPVAADMTGARVLGVSRPRHVIKAAELGLGTIDPDRTYYTALTPEQARRVFLEREGNRGR